MRGDFKNYRRMKILRLLTGNRTQDIVAMKYRNMNTRELIIFFHLRDS